MVYVTVPDSIMAPDIDDNVNIVSAMQALADSIQNALKILPYAVSSGSVITSGDANTTRTVPISFPADLFTEPPIVTATVQTTNPQNASTPTVSGVTVSGATLHLRYTTATDITVLWHAIQQNK